MGRLVSTRGKASRMSLLLPTADHRLLLRDICISGVYPSGRHSEARLYNRRTPSLWSDRRVGRDRRG